MPFSKFVEIGRVAVLGDGPDSGKIAAIVNVIDQNRVLLDGPTAGVGRQSYPIKKLHLTPLKVNFAFNASTKVVRKEMEAEKVCKLFISKLFLMLIILCCRFRLLGKAPHGPRGWLLRSSGTV